MFLNYISAGSSHGEKILGILENFPSGITINLEDIKNWVKGRKGLGNRSKRQSGTEVIKIISGIRNPYSDPNNNIRISTGAPIGFEILNDPKFRRCKAILKPRLGHVDAIGSSKYKISYREVSERASARYTIADVLVGNLCFQALKKKFPDFNITSRVKNINNEEEDTKSTTIKIYLNNPPKFLGTYNNRMYSLDSQISARLMAIPSVRSITFGDDSLPENGGNYNNNIINNSIVGGISTGDRIEITVYSKPIPTGSNIPGEYIERHDTYLGASMSYIVGSAISYVMLDMYLFALGERSFI